MFLDIDKNGDLLLAARGVYDPPFGIANPGPSRNSCVDDQLALRRCRNEDAGDGQYDGAADRKLPGSSLHWQWAITAVAHWAWKRETSKIAVDEKGM